MKYIFAAFMVVGFLVGLVWLFTSLPGREGGEASIDSIPTGYLPTDLGEGFLSSLLVQPDTSRTGVYLLHADPYTRSPDYTIEYDRRDERFTIRLLAEPVAEVREQAEERLITVVEMPLNDICNLSVDVFVGEAPRDSAAEDTIGLSFCPNSTPLP